MNHKSLIRVSVEDNGRGLLTASSRDLKALNVSGRSLDDLAAAVVEALAAYYELVGVPASVTEIPGSRNGNRIDFDAIPLPRKVAV